MHVVQTNARNLLTLKEHYTETKFQDQLYFYYMRGDDKSAKLQLVKLQTFTRTISSIL
jgi:hypothetical protein